MRERARDVFDAIMCDPERRRRLGCEERLPRARRVEPVEHAVSETEHLVRDVRVELAPALPAHRGEGFGRTGERSMDLATKRDVKHARGRADLARVKLVRMTTAIEAFVGFAERSRDVGVDLEHRSEARSKLAVRARELGGAARIHGEARRGADAELPSRRRERTARVSRVDRIESAEQSDVVATRDARHLRRVRRAPDEAQQTAVVRRAPLRAREPELARQTRREDRDAQRRLERDASHEVGGERQPA